jgi:hypothetical protein
MTDRLLAITARHLAPDALVGVAVFAVLMAMTACQATVAAPHASQSLIAGVVVGVPGYAWPAALVLLCAVLSVLAALNLAFFRHLVRASRPPRARLADGPLQHRGRIG